MNLILFKYDFPPKKFSKTENAVYDEYNLKGCYGIGVGKTNNPSKNKDRTFFDNWEENFSPLIFRWV